MTLDEARVAVEKVLEQDKDNEATPLDLETPEECALLLLYFYRARLKFEMARRVYAGTWVALADSSSVDEAAFVDLDHHRNEGYGVNATMNLTLEEILEKLPGLLEKARRVVPDGESEA